MIVARILETGIPFDLYGQDRLTAETCDERFELLGLPAP